MAVSQISSSDTDFVEGEEELSHDFKELLSTLAKRKGWRTAHIYKYQGFWYSPKEVEALMAFQQHFQACDTDVLLVTTPKSGTVWLKALTFAIVNRNRYLLSDKHPLLTTNPHQLVPFLDLKIYYNNQVPDLSNLQTPRLFATHIVYNSLPESIKDSDCRIVYLCRNPKDTFVSFWHFMNKIRLSTNQDPLSLEEAFEMFCEGCSTYGPFWDHVLEHWKVSLEKPEKVLFLKYEEMMEDVSSHLKRLAEFLGYPFSLKEEGEGKIEEIAKLCSFEFLSKLEVNKTESVIARCKNEVYFRKGKIGDWVNYLSPEMIQRLDQITKEKLHGSNLTL